MEDGGGHLWKGEWGDLWGLFLIRESLRGFLWGFSEDRRGFLAGKYRRRMRCGWGWVWALLMEQGGD